jgi:CHRD domain
MKPMRFCLVLCAVLALSSRARADITITGNLDGSQEFPPTLSLATGTFTGDLAISGSTATLTFTVNYMDLIGGAVVQANFNEGQPGLGFGDVRDYDPGQFTSPDGSFTGTWTSSDAQPLTPSLVSDLLSGNIYFNIATQEFPTGEISGQLTAVPEPSSFLPALLASALGLALACRRADRSAWPRILPTITAPRTGKSR